MTRATRRPGGDPIRRVARPLTVLTAVGTAAHHTCELAGGVGLVLQPELGLAGASGFWGVQIPLWAAVAARGGRRWDRALAAASGAALAGASVHFLLWPWRIGRVGLPVLTHAEGLDPARLPAYNAVLWVWGLAAGLSILTEVSSRDRRWALVGLASLPALRWSARHHFSWVVGQAATDPQWWNRGLQRTPSSG